MCVASHAVLFKLTIAFVDPSLPCAETRKHEAMEVPWSGWAIQLERAAGAARRATAAR